MEHVERHYDGAKHGVSAEERLRGPAAPMKQYHNSAKRQLYASLVPSPRASSRLLDIGVGRGGDVRKWVDLGVGFVKGYDVSSTELKEARRRAKSYDLPCKFETTKNLGKKTWQDADGPFQAASCMFALNYFFDDETTARNLLSFVYDNLVPGGAFFGVVCDASRVNEVLMDGTPIGDGVQLVAKWSGMPGPFGAAYTLSIEDTVVDSESLVEYLVYEDVLHALARSVGFRVDRPFVRLAQTYEGKPGLTIATSLYASFVLRKPIDMPPSGCSTTSQHGT